MPAQSYQNNATPSHPLLLLLVHRHHPLGQVRQQIVDHISLLGLGQQPLIRPTTKTRTTENAETHRLH